MDKDRAKHKRDLLKKHELEKHARKAQAAGDGSVSSVVAASRQKQLHRKV